MNYCNGQIKIKFEREIDDWNKKGRINYGEEINGDAGQVEG